MKSFRYKLQEYKGPPTRHNCPACGGKKAFARYIDLETGNELGDKIGRCNRENQCGYHLTPKDTGHSLDKDWRPVQKSNDPAKPFKYISLEAMKQSMAGYESNNLMRYLRDSFGIDQASRLAKVYYIGTSKKWPGANIFYQVDSKQRIHRGKIMVYNPETGRRDHSRNHSVHAVSGLSDQKPAECFFGEHLLANSSNRVAIVESEKTALISSLYLPDFTWLACGGLSMLNYEKCKALAGRDVILWPDLGGYELWKEKAGLLLPKVARSWKVSDFLERIATEEERKSGLDLADYLIRYRPEEFKRITKIAKPTRSDPQPVQLAISEVPAPADLVSEPELVGESIEELTNFFERASLPETIQLDLCTFIRDVPAFVQSHLSIANSSNRINRPYIDRLHRLKFILENEAR